MSYWLRRVFFHLLATFMAGLVCWAVAFLWFIWRVPTETPALAEPVDGIVILTGGSLRVKEGIELLLQGRGQHLLISGVGAGVRMQDIETNYPSNIPADMKQRITLGYAALSTQGNAEEAAAWAEEQKIRSIVLVTAYYHIPRAMLEFTERLPGVRIISQPVFPYSEDEESRWVAVRLMVREFHKFLFRWWQFRTGSFAGEKTL